ncbi:MAG TPA: hypothetical protein VK797_16065 [Tepidisphaeraceae bacterium]|jgi:hypothetical protein|nr:hypothetical protein [Tepidisphaeraceae bacterium]
MTTAAPDWSVTAETVQCPLCDYNLRGLTQPRCPECGYAFDWQDLVDPQRRRHEYLFEHHPRRPIRAFFKTITRSFRPGRFWKTLYPSQPVNTRRLVVYGLICSFVALSPALAAIAATDDAIFPRTRAASLRLIWSTTWSGYARAPTLNGLDYVRYFLINQRDAIVYAASAAAIYPLLCALTLLLFHQTMRNARIKPGHAIRVAIYSGDIVFWFGVWLLALAAASGILMPDPFRDSYFVLREGIAFGAVAVLLLTSLRMRAGYRHYLRFPHASATVAATQLMVLLLIIWFVPLSVFIELYNLFT